MRRSAYSEPYPTWWRSSPCYLTGGIPTGVAKDAGMLSFHSSSEQLGSCVSSVCPGLASVKGFAGPYAFGYLHTRTGSFMAGFAVLMFCAFAAAILMLATPVAVDP